MKIYKIKINHNRANIMVKGINISNMDNKQDMVNIIKITNNKINNNMVKYFTKVYYNKFQN